MVQIDEDIKQRIKVIGIFFLQSYKILMGTMSSIFIPQNCGDTMCTLTQNYNNSELYHKSLFYNIPWKHLQLKSLCSENMHRNQ